MREIEIDESNITAKRVVSTSFVVNIFDIVLNSVVAFFSGSVVLVAGALEGVADLTAASFLMVGIKRSRKPADSKYPFGHGRELYIWSFAAALLMMTLTAGLSVYFGWQRFIRPHDLQNLPFAFGVLIFSLITNSYSFSLSLRRLFRRPHSERIWQRFFRSSQVEIKTTFILDLMGTLAALSGLVALLAFGATGQEKFDGIGAIVIGVITAVLSFFLVQGIKDLLVGKSVSGEVQSQIRAAVLEVPQVKQVLDLRTMIIGADRLLVNVEVHVSRDLDTLSLEQLIDKIKDNVKNKVPATHHIQVELETPDESVSVSAGD